MNTQISTGKAKTPSAKAKTSQGTAGISGRKAETYLGNAFIS